MEKRRPDPTDCAAISSPRPQANLDQPWRSNSSDRRRNRSPPRSVAAPNPTRETSSIGFCRSDASGALASVAEHSLPQQAHVERHENHEHHGQEPGKACEVVAGPVAEEQPADALRQVIQRIRGRDRG